MQKITAMDVAKYFLRVNGDIFPFPFLLQDFKQ
jgi:hypothetical protein